MAPRTEYEPSRALTDKMYYLQKHDGYFPPGADPHGMGMRMAGRYHRRFIDLGYLVVRCAAITRVSEAAGSALMLVLDKLIEAKRHIRDMGKKNVCLDAGPPVYFYPDSLDEVRDKVRPDVLVAVTLLADTHTVRPGRVDEVHTPPVWRLDSLYDAFMAIASDLAIDTTVYAMRDPGEAAPIIEQLLDCWLDLADLFALAPHEK